MEPKPNIPDSDAPKISESVVNPWTTSEERYPQLRSVPTMVPWSTKLTVQLRTKFFLTGVLFPAICLVMISLGFSSSVGRPWQSGQLEEYVEVLTSAPAIYAFFPLLLFSFGCLTRWCIWPHQSNSIWNWLGLFSGVILALTFAILLCTTTGLIGQIMALFVVPILAVLVFLVDLGIRMQIFRTRFSIKYLLILTALVALALGVGAAFGDAFSVLETAAGFGFLILLFIVGSSPTVGFITFFRVTAASTYLIRLQNDRPVFGLKTVAALMAWFAAFAATWRAAIDLMMTEYAKLPTSNPNCYVSSAAANGHPRFVGAFNVGPKRTVIINSQMQRLKFLEFALAALLPSVHQMIRRIYDKIGPLLAKVVQTNKWLSDLTFVALKPFEWSAILLSRVIRVPMSKVDGIYHH